MTCCVCEKHFGEKDDVVVCPECGAPYHRACYAENGACIFEKEHVNGFEYAPPQTEKEGARCANCGADNKSINLFCEHCGSPLRKLDDETNKFNSVNEENNGAGENADKTKNNPIKFNMVNEQGSVPFEMFLNSAQQTRNIDDIPTNEWARFIGKSAPFYLYQFNRMDAATNKFKVTFCWSALFFSTFYFAYRKMYSWALLSAIGALIVNIPSTLSMLASLGVGFAQNISSSSLNTMSFICSILSWALSAFFCFFSFYLYRQHATRKIKNLKAKNFNESEYFEKLENTGEPSIIGVVIVFAIIFAISYAFTMWIGVDNIYSLYNL